MLHISVPTGRRLVWYLAMEEYLAKHVKEETFVTWVVSPTVIFGRHQVMAAEVNVDFCHANGIAMYRRKSGGGCVYADGGNLMMSLISPSTHSEQVFQSFLDRIAAVLCDMGYAASKSGHNDIMVDGYKVSGNACYALPTGTIVHGTMLVNVDFDALPGTFIIKANNGDGKGTNKIIRKSELSPEQKQSYMDMIGECEKIGDYILNVVEQYQETRAKHKEQEL